MMPLSRALPPVFTALVLASCGAAPSQGAPFAGATGDTPPSDELALVLREVNAARAVARVCGSKPFGPTGPVTWNAQLAAAAQAHARDMATRDYFSHVSPEGGVLKQRVEAAGYVNWRELGENIAGGYAASEVIPAWLKSADHCMTLMDPALHEVGIAVVTADSAQNEFTNYWVQDFGTR